VVRRFCPSTFNDPYEKLEAKLTASFQKSPWQQTLKLLDHQDLGGLPDLSFHGSDTSYTPREPVSKLPLLNPVSPDQLAVLNLLIRLLIPCVS
jgi:hypothetical protein